MGIQLLTEEEVRFIARDEIRKFVESGLMYTHTEKPTPAQPASTEQKEEKDKLDFNPELVNWKTQEGKKGYYERANDGPNYTLLKNYLQKHSPPNATINGYFYWIFTDGDAIGRKQKGTN